MSERRRYRQFCGLAKALDVVGERWTLLLVREFLLGPRRYTDLQHALPGLTTNLLSKRLREMESAGLIERTTLPPPAPSRVYRLTERGAALEPVLMALGRWGESILREGPAPGDRMDPAWALISMKRRYAGGEDLKVELQVGGRVFQLHLAPEGLVVREGQPWSPRLRLEMGLEGFRGLLFSRTPPGALTERGLLHVEGSQGDLDRFLAALGLTQA